MIGVDTNVLLRLLLRDDAAQSAAAEKMFAASVSVEEPAVINAITLSEAVWALRNVYALPKENVLAILDGLLAQSDVEIVPEEAVRRALTAWSRGSAEFADYLVAEINRAIGCTTTFTFDRAAATADGFTLVSA